MHLRVFRWGLKACHNEVRGTPGYGLEWQEVFRLKKVDMLWICGVYSFGDKFRVIADSPLSDSGLQEVPRLRVYQAKPEDVSGLQDVSDDQLVPKM